MYDDMFYAAIDESLTNQKESKEKRPEALIAMGVTLLALIIFLIIPVLLQIEINTRPPKSNSI